MNKLEKRICEVLRSVFFTTLRDLILRELNSTVWPKTAKLSSREILQMRKIQDTLSRKNMSAESDENFEGVTKSLPDKILTQFFLSRPKLLRETFTQVYMFTRNFIPQRKFKSNFLHLYLPKLVF